MKKILILTAFSIMSLSLQAQELVGSMKVFAIESVNGKEVREEAKTVENGDVIEYEITYENKSTEVFENVGIKGKIPEGTTLVKGSETPSKELYYTIDNGQTWSIKPMIRSIDNGDIVQLEAPLTDYTDIKWNVVEFPANETKVFVYRVKVNEN
tara:strand:+ start:13912 stop:14373 length:462 start_codon:yes stop_codon:yes gene_type:complete